MAPEEAARQVVVKSKVVKGSEASELHSWPDAVEVPSSDNRRGLATCWPLLFCRLEARCDGSELAKWTARCNLLLSVSVQSGENRVRDEGREERLLGAFPSAGEAAFEDSVDEICSFDGLGQSNSFPAPE